MLSDEDSSTGLLIFSFCVWCRVGEKLGIAAGDAHSDDDSEFVSVSDVSVGCRFDCTAHSFAVVVSSGVSACACAFHSVPMALHIGKVVTGRPVRLLLPFAFARLLVGAGVVALLLLLLLAGVTLLLLIVCALLFVGVGVTIVGVTIDVAVGCPWCWRKCSRAQTVRCSFVQPSGLLFFFRFRVCRCLLRIRASLSFSGWKNA